MQKLKNHRMVGVGRDLRGSSSPTPPAEAGSPAVLCLSPVFGCGGWFGFFLKNNQSL